MREIKFRAWLPAIKKMTYTHTLEELMNWNTTVESNGTAIWMQYTGLKDKDGVEVYEGDILHRGGYWDLYVDFIDGAFCLVSCIEIQRINWSPTPIWNAGIPGREVIGNIHDNPELLGGAE